MEADDRCVLVPSTRGVNCALGTLASGQSTTVDITLRPAAATGETSFNADVTSDATDPNLTNNETGATIKIVGKKPKA